MWRIGKLSSTQFLKVEHVADGDHRSTIVHCVNNRENNRQAEIKDLTSRGIIPHEHEMEKHPEKSLKARSWLIGKVSARIHDVLPAKTIVDNMVAEAIEQLRKGASMVSTSPRAKL